MAVAVKCRLQVSDFFVLCHWVGAIILFGYVKIVCWVLLAVVAVVVLWPVNSAWYVDVINRQQPVRILSIYLLSLVDLPTYKPVFPTYSPVVAKDAAELALDNNILSTSFYGCHSVCATLASGVIVIFVV